MRIVWLHDSSLSRESGEIPRQSANAAWLPVSACYPEPEYATPLIRLQISLTLLPLAIEQVPGSVRVPPPCRRR
jgi:hypothetical protein